MQSQQAPEFSNKQLLTLVSIARKALLAYMQGKKPPKISDDEDGMFGDYSNEVFVNVKYNGKKYGCMGCSNDSLVVNIQDAAKWIIKAKDHERFGNYEALTAEKMRIAEISILIVHSEEVLVFNSDEEILGQLTKKKHGLRIFLDNTNASSSNEMNATYLPLVWRSITDEWDFLENLKIKAVKNGGKKMSEKLKENNFIIPEIIRAERYQTIEFASAPKPPFSPWFWERIEKPLWGKAPSYSESVHKNYCFNCHACAFHERPYLENKAKESSEKTAELVI